MAKEKVNAHLIREVLAELRQKYQGSSQREWPNYLFHFSHVENIANILNLGWIYSRTYSKESDIDIHDTASEEVLAGTIDEVKDSVRFYFRPLTPMLYHVEGFSPDPSKLKYANAYCPMPVYLLFDSESILCQRKTKFSNGNAGSRNPTIYNQSEDFSKLEFRDIYHTGKIIDRQRSQVIVHRRHAEVLVPEACNLDHLKKVWCRSEAERETLLSLLGKEVRNRYNDKILIKREAFNGKRLFLISVEHYPPILKLRFNTPESDNNRYRNDGPYELRCELMDHDTGEVFTGYLDTDSLTGVFKVSHSTGFNSYNIRLYLNNYLAYAGSYETTMDIPF